MKVIKLTLLALTILSVNLSAQIFDPVKWNFKTEKVGDDTYELVFKADIEDHWHLYSQHLPSDDGPIATAFYFDESTNVERLDGVTESESITEFDKVNEMELTFFEHEAIFRQKVKVKSSGIQKVSGYLEYMVCDDEKCLPPATVDFNFEVGEVSPTGDNTESSMEENTASIDMEGTEAPQEDGLFEPVKWSFQAKNLEGNKYDIYISASIDKGWHLYAQELPSEDGPLPTEIRFFEEGSKAEGKVREEGDLLNEYDPNFLMDLSYYKNKVDFVQTVVVEKDGFVKGDIYFMVCDDEKCLPPQTIEFQFEWQNEELVFVSPEATTGESVTDLNNLEKGTFSPLISNVDLENPATQCGDDFVAGSVAGKGYMTIFLLGFLGGLIALLTPCVFPMIPLTVSFFTKGSEDKKKGIVNSVMYGFFIFFIYILLSLPFHIFDSVDSDILNTISTNVYLNVFFFVIFIVFAISFFGYFELTLPSRFTNKVDTASNVGGIIGIFFMALTLALVSFSCTGPILGSLLAGSLSSDGGAMQLTMGMGGFGLALALPFALFAMFPRWLHSLPKSGGWLNSVKVVLGFIEIALAIKFLSNADLVAHWNIVKYELFMGAWIIIAVALALYLLAKIKFPHDSPIEKLSVTRWSLAGLTIVFAIYLVSGFRYDEKAGTYHSLSLLSGLAPPAGYSWVYPSKCPLNIDCFKDYEEGLAYAKKVNKPIMIDFTGYACVNCRKMEETVWNQPEILSILKEDVVLISLYVDDKAELPEEEQITVPIVGGKTKKFRTVGDKWQTLEMMTFNRNTQPWYALLSPDEKLLNNPVGYTPDVEEYRAFLKCGIQAHNNKGELSAID